MNPAIPINIMHCGKPNITTASTDKPRLSGWFVYLIRTSAGTLYTGVTRDVARRFAEHQSGGAKAAKALRGRGPLTLAFHCAMRSKSDALKLEAAIKKWPKSKKEQLVLEGIALVQVSSLRVQFK